MSDDSQELRMDNHSQLQSSVSLRGVKYECITAAAVLNPSMHACYAIKEI